MNNLPKINLKELKKAKAENFKDRLAFLDKYSNWLDKSKTKLVTKSQKNIIDTNSLKLNSPKIKYRVNKK